MSLDEVESALDQVVDLLWDEFDAQMGELWADASERSRAAETFELASLYEAEPTEAHGIVRLALDLEADLAAEPLSSRVDAPVVAARTYGEDWCRLVLFEKGRARAWLFWASDGWSEEFEGEVEPALAGAARANGGWVGDPGPFSVLLDAGYGPGDLKRLLRSRSDEASDFVEGFYRLCGLPGRG